MDTYNCCFTSCSTSIGICLIDLFTELDGLVGLVGLINGLVGLVGLKGLVGLIGVTVLGDSGGDNGFSTTLINGLRGLLVLPGCGVGVLGISTTGLGVLCGTKSDCPLDRNIPFRTGHGALLDILTRI